MWKSITADGKCWIIITEREKCKTTDAAEPEMPLLSSSTTTPDYVNFSSERTFNNAEHAISIWSYTPVRYMLRSVYRWRERPVQIMASGTSHRKCLAARVINYPRKVGFGNKAYFPLAVQFFLCRGQFSFWQSWPQYLGQRRCLVSTGWPRFSHKVALQSKGMSKPQIMVWSWYKGFSRAGIDGWEGNVLLSGERGERIGGTISVDIGRLSRFHTPDKRHTFVFSSLQAPPALFPPDAAQNSKELHILEFDVRSCKIQTQKN